MAKRPTPRPSRAPETSARPSPNPSRRAGSVDRGNDQDPGPVRRDMERGMKTGGKVKKMAGGGKCRGMGAASRGGNYRSS